MNTAPKAFLIARSHRDAIATATIEWGWEQVTTDRFVTPTGETVEYVSSMQKLRGLPRPTKIYRGFQWFQNGGYDLFALNWLTSTGALSVATPEKGQQAA